MQSGEFKIGDVSIKGRLVLGPMAGVTDLPFRCLCKEQGADLLYTEMVSAKGLLYNNKNTEALLSINECERPVALQIFGEDAQIMADMARKLENRKFDILDINMGCPVLKVVNNGEGSALLKDIGKLGRIVGAVASATKKPITVKIRKGYGENDNVASEAAKAAEANGAAAIAVHGRTRSQFYGGKADWEVIRQVKEAVKIPVIGNGDVFTPEAARRMLECTGCDAVMIARAARGNPWIFAQLKAYFASEEYVKPTFNKIIETVERHARMLIAYKRSLCSAFSEVNSETYEILLDGLKGTENSGVEKMKEAKITPAADLCERAAIREMRKHVAWYTAGFPNSARLRARASEIETMGELTELLGMLLD